VQAEEDLKKITLAWKEKALKFRKVETAQITLNTDTTLKLINAESKLWNVEDQALEKEAELEYLRKLV